MPKCRPLQLKITRGCPICPYHVTALDTYLISQRVVGQRVGHFALFMEGVVAVDFGFVLGPNSGPLGCFGR